MFKDCQSNTLDNNFRIPKKRVVKQVQIFKNKAGLTQTKKPHKQQMQNNHNQTYSQSNNPYTNNDENQLINSQTQSLQLLINQINNNLKGVCTERLGNLANPNPAEIRKVLQLIQVLIFQVRRLLDFKDRMISQRRQVQEALLSNTSATEKISKDKRIVENQKQSLAQKVKNLEAALKQALDKSKVQKQELHKQVKHFQTRQKTFENQLRKKDNEMKQLQDRVKKYQERNQFINTNSFEIMQKFPKDFGNSGLEYTKFSQSSFDKIVSEFTKQNDHLRSYLITIFKEFKELAEEIKYSLNKNKKSQKKVEEYSKLAFNESLFGLPIQKYEKTISQFIEDIRSLKQLLRYENSSNQEQDSRKQGEIHGTKAIISNYKEIIDFQGQFIQKFFQQPQENYLNKSKEQRRSFLNETESDTKRLNTFIQEYAHKFEEKNKNFQTRIQKFQETIKQMQQNKAYVKNNVKGSNRDISRQVRN